MWQFSEAIDGITEACNALETPITGGNVSFYNETLGKSIYPTPVIGILGVHRRRCARSEDRLPRRGRCDRVAGWSGRCTAPNAGDQPRSEFSSSEYSKAIAGIVAGEPPAIDLAAEKRLQRIARSPRRRSDRPSAHDISDGGLAIALAESCFAATSETGASASFGAK